MILNKIERGFLLDYLSFELSELHPPPSFGCLVINNIPWNKICATPRTQFQICHVASGVEKVIDIISQIPIRLSEPELNL